MHRILIIDDEEDVLVPLKNLLEREGFEVATLSRGGTTFKTVDVFKPDVMLLDIKLSEHDGRDICYELKSNNKTKNIKIILCSAHVLGENGYVDYGADDFISKPFKIQSLVKKINRHLKEA
jgi:DNA-binding response OmpR family regulator